MEEFKKNKGLFITLIFGGVLFLGALIFFTGKGGNGFNLSNFGKNFAPGLGNNAVINGFTALQAPTFNFPDVAYASDIQNSVSIYNSTGEKIEAQMEAKRDGGGTAVKITNAQQFTPGKYTIEVVKNGKKIDQDFTWGVLAINPDKATYKPGENAFLSLAVLDEKGKMVCDGEVTLTIKDPGGKTTTLTSKNKSIKVNPECYLKKYVEKPDYEANYKTTVVGSYEMVLTAKTANGTYTVKDYFTAENNTPFDVQRTSATRIFPYATYPVEIKITANQDFSGQIKESVPASFKINKLDNAVGYQNIEEGQDVNYIVWNVNLKKGETINIGYKYNAPIISPQFYLIGALTFYPKSSSEGFRENRFWQIAADDIVFVQELGTGTGAGATINVSTTTTVGNYIVVGVYDATINGSSISDSKGNTYSLDVGCVLSGSNTVDIYTAKITTALASGDTITAGAAGGGTITISAAEYSGLNKGTRLDKSSCSSSSVGSTSYDSGLTAATTQNDELIIGVLARTGTATTVTPEVLSPVWNSNTQAGSVVNGYVNPTYRIVSSTGTFANKGTLAVSKPWASAVATYKMARSSYNYLNKILNTSGLVAYWRLGESSGFPQDSSGNANNATAGTATQGVSGALVRDNNRANTFNGSSNFWTVPNNTSYNLGDTFTISLWIKRTRTGVAEYVMDKGAFGGTHSWGVLIDSTDHACLVDGFNDGTIVRTSSTITDTNWHHVLFTKNGSTSHAYLDGLLNEVVGTNVTFTDQTTTLYIAEEADTSTKLNGSIDEISLFNVVFTSDQVIDQYKVGSPYAGNILTTSGLKGYWRLDESSGNIRDISGNGNTSTAVSGTPTYSQSGALSSDSDTAVTLTGNATGFDVSHNSSLNHGDTFSIEAWIKPTDLSFGSQSYYWYFGKSASGHGWAVGVGGTASGSDQGRLLAYQLWTGTMFAQSPNNIVSAGNWYHVVFTKSGSTRQWYVNGQPVSTTGTDYTVTNTSDNVGVGALGGSGFTTNSYHGALDDVSYYNVALTPAQVKQHYYLGVSQNSSLGAEGIRGQGLRIN